MSVTVGDLFIFVASYFVIMGIWSFIWLKVHKKGYEMEKQEDETFYDFLCRYYKDDLLWKLRQRLNIRWFYNSRVFGFFIRLKGLILVLVGVAIFIALYLVGKTEFGLYLDIVI